MDICSFPWFARKRKLNLCKTEEQALHASELHFKNTEIIVLLETVFTSNQVGALISTKILSI